MTEPDAATGGPMREHCRRCHHPQEWHTHDDHDCLSKHPQPCSPDVAPFRCLGADIWKPGFLLGTPETRCGCVDYVTPPTPEHR